MAAAGWATSESRGRRGSAENGASLVSQALEQIRGYSTLKRLPLNVV